MKKDSSPVPVQELGTLLQAEWKNNFDGFDYATYTLYDQEIAGKMMEYYCTITEDSGLYGVEFPDLPSVITVGSTREEALAMASDALNSALESDVSRGLSMPEPSAKVGADLYPIEVAPHIVIAWQIRRFRGERSQSEIAARLGLTYQAYQRLENPMKGNPTVKTLERVARALGKRLEVRIA